jgi:lysozyme family protein
MVPDFKKAVKNVLEREGILTDDPDDSGGLTKYGISQKAFPNIDITNLTREQAIEIYRELYWERSGASKVQSQLVAEELFDTSVNMGVTTAVTIMQRSVNKLSKMLCDAGYKSKNLMLSTDGIFGSRTQEAVNSVVSRWDSTLWKIMNHLQFSQYELLVESRPANAQFLLGWINRRTFEIVED